MKRYPLRYLAHRFLLQPQTQRVIGTAQRAHGIDLSLYEPTFDSTIPEPGLIDFAFLKATQGATIIDPAYLSLSRDIQSIPVKGAYHYMRSNVDGITQAQLFLGTIANTDVNVIIGDFEAYLNDLSDNFVREFYIFLDTITRRRPDCKVLVYSNPNMYDSWLYPAAKRMWAEDKFLRWDFWVAQYPWVVNVDGQPSMPTNRKDWKFWQYSEAGDPKKYGTGGWCDLNIFNGSRQQLLAWANVSEPVPNPDPVPSGDIMDILLGTIVAGELNIRSVPTSTGNTPIGKLLAGQRVIGGPKQNGWWKILAINNVPTTQESWAYEGANNGYIRQDGAISVASSIVLPSIEVSHIFKAAGYPDLALTGTWKPNA